MPTLPDGIDLHQVETRLVARQGWVLGIIVRHATPLVTAWRWWTGSASGVALSEADAVARCAAKQDGHSSKSDPRVRFAAVVGLALLATGQPGVTCGC
jgi:hypothetical protein